jgi:hypothetical protein
VLETLASDVLAQESSCHTTRDAHLNEVARQILHRLYFVDQGSELDRLNVRIGISRSTELCESKSN